MVVALDVKAGRPHPVRQVSGTEIRLDREDLQIMSESEVMGVIDTASPARNKAA